MVIQVCCCRGTKWTFSTDVYLEVELEFKTNSLAKPVCPLWATVETGRSQAEGDPNQYTHTQFKTNQRFDFTGGFKATLL